MSEHVMDGSTGENIINEPERHYVPHKEIFTERSPRSPLITHSPPLSTLSRESDSIHLPLDEAVDTSIEQLYNNVCEMQSSDHSPSRYSFLSYGEESRIDSELRFLAGGDYVEVEIKKEVVTEHNGGDTNSEEEKRSNEDLEDANKIHPYPTEAKRLSHLQFNSEASRKANLRSKTFQGRPPKAKENVKSLKKLSSVSFPKNERSSALEGVRFQNGNVDHREPGYLGPYLLKQARDVIASGDNSQKALELALRAMKSFERRANAKPNLDLAMCLHVVAAIYCRLGQHTEAIPILERSIEIPVMNLGQNHALAKFSGCMQLGDTYAMLGQIENSILCYTAGLEIQQLVLGEKDLRFGETCRYLAEAHVQAMQFGEAEKLCLMALDIHKEKGSSASPEEAADRRLLGLICESKGDYEGALEQYVLASMAMAANGQNADVAAIDCSIGDAYLSLARYDEAIFSYQKALNMLKSNKGENHPSVASVFVRLADLYNKIGKFSDSKSYCEIALRIYSKPLPGNLLEEIASSLVDISAIYESMNEPDQALQLLQKAIKVYGSAPGQQTTIAGIEAQTGVLFYILGSYSDSYDSLKNAISKFRATGEKKSALFGITLNQMGLACVQLYSINEAADFFEEAKSILEAECGPYHADTLGVYSNLAGTYDAMGRTDDAIEIMEYVIGMREEKLKTANLNADDERRRLAELLKDAGTVRRRKSLSLEMLLVNTSQTAMNDSIMVS
ncbi:tetratricopeptide repeat 28-like [Olea europaea subsp. europaea]|uniref:Tetratricopeptide repeat 28-like n=2 Tax=Olea europaea subsp. europaea TaxID=158383 RepID=A0A8S0RSY0_OLEEU|nr:tetratricopeptide repeat 28-like [Olea europaea subsp. europaea]